jgi:hypothetical protein
MDTAAADTSAAAATNIAEMIVTTMIGIAVIVTMMIGIAVIVTMMIGIAAPNADRYDHRHRRTLRLHLHQLLSR